MNLIPKFAYLIVEREKLKTTIILPDKVDKRLATCYGIVRAVGPTAEDDIKALIGKKILFKQHAGNWMEDPNGEEIYVLHEEDVIAEVSA